MRVLAGLGVLMLAAGCGDDSSGSGGGGGEGTTSGETSAETTAVVTASVASTATSTGSGEGGSGEGGSGEGGSGEGGSGEGGAAVGEWGCLEDPPDAPTFENGPAATVEITVRGFLGEEGLPDVTVRVCEYTDPDCTNPSDEAITDADGVVEVDVPTSARHYLDVSGDGLYTTLAFPNGPIPDGAAFPFGVLTTEEMDQFVELTGDDVVLDPDRGIIGISVFDCDAALAPGVTFEVDIGDDDTLTTYFSEAGFPSPDATETTTDGQAGLVNVPEGEATVVATVAATGDEISTRTVLVRAGAISYTDGFSPVPMAVE